MVTSAECLIPACPKDKSKAEVLLADPEFWTSSLCDTQGVTLHVSILTLGTILAFHVEDEDCRRTNLAYTGMSINYYCHGLKSQLVGNRAQCKCSQLFAG